jgi:hemoglobin-like flavoprotein
MNPNAGHADYAAMMTKYPALAEHLGKAFKVMDEGQQQNALNFGTRVYAAQLAGNNDLAASCSRIAPRPTPRAQHYTTMADLIRSRPRRPARSAR